MTDKNRDDVLQSSMKCPKCETVALIIKEGYTVQPVLDANDLRKVENICAGIRQILSEFPGVCSPVNEMDRIGDVVKDNIRLPVQRKRMRAIHASEYFSMCRERGGFTGKVIKTASNAHRARLLVVLSESCTGEAI